VTKTQSVGPISCLEHRATRALHCAIVTKAAVLMFPLLLQSVISNQMRPRRLRGAWFSRLLRHPARRRSGSILSPGTHTGYSRSAEKIAKCLRGDGAFAVAGPRLRHSLPTPVRQLDLYLDTFRHKLETYLTVRGTMQRLVALA